MTLQLRKAWKQIQKRAMLEEAERKRVVVDEYTIPQHVNTSRFVDASINNDKAEVQLLLDKKQDINALHPQLGYSALHAAVDQGHMVMVQLLVECGANVNLPRKRERKLKRGAMIRQKRRSQNSTKLVYHDKNNINNISSITKQTTTLKCQQKNTEPKVIQNHKSTEIVEVNTTGSVSDTSQRVRYFEKPETSLDTPLHFAALSGRTEIVTYLLQECKAVKDPLNSAQKTPLDYARLMKKWDTEVLFYEPPTPPGNLKPDSLKWLDDRLITFTFYKSIADPQDKVPVLEYEFIWRLKDPIDDERNALVIREAKDWQVIKIEAKDIYQQYYDVKLCWEYIGLLPAHTYVLRARGRNLVGWSPWTSTLVYTTPVARPEAPDPAPFSVTTTPSTIALRWYEPIDNGAPVLQYEVQMKRGPTSRACRSQPWKKYKLVVDTDLKLLKLTAGDCHLFRMRARNRAGWGEYSTESEEIWTYKAINVLEVTPRTVNMSWGKARPGPLVFKFEMQVLRLRDVPNLFYTLQDEIDPITIPDKYWRILSQDISGELFLAQGHIPPPGTSSKGFVFGDSDRPFLEPNSDYMFRCRSHHEDFGWADWGDGIASEIVALPCSFPDQLSSPLQLHSSNHDSVVIAWDEPLENGAYIDRYHVEMLILQSSQQPDRHGFDMVSADMRHAPADYQLPDRLMPAVDTLPRANWQTVDESVAHDQRSFEVLGLDFFTRYRFRVSAKNRCGWSQAGMHSDVFCTAAVAPPGIPYQSPSDDSEPLPVFRFHQTASHTISKIAVSWNPSRVLTAPYRIQTYNLQSLIVDAASLDNDKKKNEEKWVDHGTIDVPEGFPQDQALTWFYTKFETTRQYRFRVRALCDQHDAGNDGWSAFCQPSRPLGIRRKL